MIGKQSLVMLMSFGVFGLSSAGMYVVWLGLSAVPTLPRDLVALAGWIAGFAGGAILMWRATDNLKVEVLKEQ